MFVYMYIYTFTYDMSRIGVFGMCRISLNDSVTLSEEDARIRERPLAKASSGFLAGMAAEEIVTAANKKTG